jgi:cold shock CspA family protein
MVIQKRHIGIVSGWNNDKQYGFVNSMNDGVRYFLHRSRIDQDVCDGSVVEFEIWNDKEDQDKVFAAKVIVIEMPEKRHRQ